MVKIDPWDTINPNRYKVRTCYGCGRPVYGGGQMKWCPECRAERHRRSNRKHYWRVPRKVNQILEPCRAGETRQYTCALDGCTKEFEVRVWPFVRIYPKYCEEHRNEYKRKRFIKLRKLDEQKKDISNI